ncbi:unnamed protein product, partial [Ascophyllum nodosum]
GNNCFLNAALGLALAVFDGQSLPDSSYCTPAAAAFFSAFIIIKDNMFQGNPLQQRVLGCYYHYYSRDPSKLHRRKNRGILLVT